MVLRIERTMVTTGEAATTLGLRLLKRDDSNRTAFESKLEGKSRGQRRPIYELIGQFWVTFCLKIESSCIVFLVNYSN